ncbi:MAG: hypothetical protein IPO27_16595 [Bacteroidetes bacterium]|nr:hypothetical protein [Bacteroidota bacterium]
MQQLANSFLCPKRIYSKTLFKKINQIFFLGYGLLKGNASMLIHRAATPVQMPKYFTVFIEQLLVITIHKVTLTRKTKNIANTIW